MVSNSHFVLSEKLLVRQAILILFRIIMRVSRDRLLMWTMIDATTVGLVVIARSVTPDG